MPERARLPSIPRPLLRRVENTTPFAHFVGDKMGPSRRFFDVVVVRGTFVLAPGRLTRAEEQAPVVLADEVWDSEDAARSSLKQAGDLHLAKPGADVCVTGTARAPDGQARPRWDVAVAVHGAWQALASHTLVACGPRAWHYVRGDWLLAEPRPTAEVPIRYELAYGGAFRDPHQEWTIHKPNPSGRGFADASTADRRAPLPAPQWELPSRPVRRLGEAVPVAGLGPLARFWSARAQYAGTYDDLWRAKASASHAAGAPIDYPPDFDARFFHTAPPELRASRPLRGDERIGLVGLVAGHPRFTTQLPGVEVVASLFVSGGTWVEQAMSLDTVHIDLDAARVALVWRLVLDRARGVTGAVIGWRNMS